VVTLETLPQSAWVWAVHGVLALFILAVSRPFGNLLRQYRDDYQPISSLFEEDTRIGFNAVYRFSLAPLGIVLLSIGLSLGGLDQLVEGIWLVSVWFLALQIGLLISIGRWRLAGKAHFFALHLISIALSLFLCLNLIVNGLDHLLPDEANLRTDVWILIAAFFYGVLRNTKFRPSASAARKIEYVGGRARSLRRRYATALSGLSRDTQNAVLALMIYEDFNRPRVIRWVEKLTRARTQGILQTTTRRGDAADIVTAAADVNGFWNAVDYPSNDWLQDRHNLTLTFQRHNPDDPLYGGNVQSVYEALQGLYGSPAEGLSDNDGYVTNGCPLSPFGNSSPAVTRLDEKLRVAVQEAATAAGAEGITVWITSGWRSERYQRALFDQAVVECGSKERAARHVAEASLSAHVLGAAVDLFASDGYAWLTQNASHYGLRRPLAQERWHFELDSVPEEAGTPKVR